MSVELLREAIRRLYAEASDYEKGGDFAKAKAIGILAALDTLKIDSVLNELTTLRNTAEALVAGAWRPIESAPRDGTEVLVWCRDEALIPLVMAYSSREYFEKEYGDPDYMEAGWYTSYSYPEGFAEVTHNPTHWQPLPTPPGAPQ
jgi:hypothetical protein